MIGLIALAVLIVLGLLSGALLLLGLAFSLESKVRHWRRCRELEMRRRTKLEA